MVSTVLNLANDEKETFCLAPEDALVSAAILADKRAGDLTNQKVRAVYKGKIRRGKQFAVIGDLAVKM